MNTIIQILAIIIALIGIIELSLFSVYGRFVKEERVKEYLDKRDGNFQLNPYSKTILSYHLSYDGKFVAKHPPVSFLSKYHIVGLGRVRRWSKEDKRIDNIFKTLKLK